VLDTAEAKPAKVAAREMHVVSFIGGDPGDILRLLPFVSTLVSLSRRIPCILY